jgi:hypothetical protein
MRTVATSCLLVLSLFVPHGSGWHRAFFPDPPPLGRLNAAATIADESKKSKELLYRMLPAGIVTEIEEVGGSFRCVFLVCSCVRRRGRVGKGA